MNVEIRKLIVRALVEGPREPARDRDAERELTPPGLDLPAQDLERLVAQCVREVLQRWDRGSEG